mgnify:CR=1 FL=1|jgi:hypothetical protein
MLIPAINMSNFSNGKPKSISSPSSELKTTYAPIGKDTIIKPNTIETNAEYGIPIV